MDNEKTQSEKKTIDIVVPVYNEEENIKPLYEKLSQTVETLSGKYRFTFTFIDNKSTDLSRKLIRELANTDKRVRAIFNAKNFGHIRSPFYALSRSDGDCAVLMAADFQDPPEKLIEFIAKWEEGYRVIYAVKKESFENKLMYFFRTVYYKLMKSVSDIPQIEHFTGFGLYDKSFLKILRDLNDPYPYMRGLVAELGFEAAEIEFKQPKRKNGKTKNKFYTLYDMAALGITTYSKKLMRSAVFISLIMGIISFIGLLSACIRALAGRTVTAIHYFGWGGFLFLSGILFFIGLLSEYVMMINQRTLKRPLVIEEERLNFPEDVKE